MNQGRQLAKQRQQGAKAHSAATASTKKGVSQAATQRMLESVKAMQQKQQGQTVVKMAPKTKAPQEKPSDEVVAQK